MECIPYSNCRFYNFKFIYNLVIDGKIERAILITQTEILLGNKINTERKADFKAEIFLHAQNDNGPIGA